MKRCEVWAREAAVYECTVGACGCSPGCIGLQGTEAMSTPSMQIAPAASGTSRSSATVSDDFPAPDLPTTAALTPPASAKLTSSSTSGRPGR